MPRPPAESHDRARNVRGPCMSPAFEVAQIGVRETLTDHRRELRWTRSAH